jgi:hypothetical protein
VAGIAFSTWLDSRERIIAGFRIFSPSLTS